jgi:hypothetical protein
MKKYKFTLRCGIAYYSVRYQKYLHTRQEIIDAKRQMTFDF